MSVINNNNNNKTARRPVLPGVSSVCEHHPGNRPDMMLNTSAPTTEALSLAAERMPFFAPVDCS